MFNFNHFLLILHSIKVTFLIYNKLRSKVYDHVLKTQNSKCQMILVGLLMSRFSVYLIALKEAYLYVRVSLVKIIKG